jgi:hypothetical protein
MADSSSDEIEVVRQVRPVLGRRRQPTSSTEATRPKIPMIDVEDDPQPSTSQGRQTLPPPVPIATPAQRREDATLRRRMRNSEASMESLIYLLGIQNQAIPNVPPLKQDYITWTFLLENLKHARLDIENRLQAIQSRAQLLDYNYRIQKDHQLSAIDSGTQTDPPTDSSGEEAEDLRISRPDPPVSPSYTPLEYTPMPMETAENN